MKLTRYDDNYDVPDHYIYKYSVYTIGNRFSDEKSARTLIERGIASHDMISLHNVVVRVRDTNRLITCAYVVDVT